MQLDVKDRDTVRRPIFADRHEGHKTADSPSDAGGNSKKVVMATSGLGNDLQHRANHEDESVSRHLLYNLSEAYSKLSHSRDEHIVLQAQAATELSTLDHKQRFVKESIQQVMTTLSADMSKGDRVAPQQKVDAIEAQLIDDNAAWDRQSQVTIDAISRSNSAHFRLAETETRMYEALKELILHLPGAENLWESMETAAEDKQDHVSAASQEVPELAQRYFDAAGGAYILQEQLEELHQLHMDERGMRSFERDRENELRTPDSIFEERHRSALLTLRKRLSETKRTAEEAKNAAQEAGIDVEDWRHRKQIDADEQRTTSDPDVPVFVNSIRPHFWTHGTVLVTPIAGNNEGPATWKHDVPAWLTNSFDSELIPLEPPNITHFASNEIVSRRDTTRKTTQGALRRYRSDTALDLGN